MSLIMNSTPNNVDLVRIAHDLRSLDGVTDIHDLHAWNISSGKVSLTVHLVVSSKADKRNTLRAAWKLMGLYNIRHSTIQIEDEGDVTGHCFVFNEICDKDSSYMRPGSFSEKTVKIEKNAGHHHHSSDDSDDDHHHKSGHGHSHGHGHGHGHHSSDSDDDHHKSGHGHSHGHGHHSSDSDDDHHHDHSDHSHDDYHGHSHA